MNVIVVVPGLPVGAGPLVREGLARRQLTMATGQCPCGAEVTLPTPAQREEMLREGGVWQVDTYHAETCPAVSDEVEQWLAGGTP